MYSQDSPSTAIAKCSWWYIELILLQFTSELQVIFSEPARHYKLTHYCALPVSPNCRIRAYPLSDLLAMIFLALFGFHAQRQWMADSIPREYHVVTRESYHMGADFNWYILNSSTPGLTKPPHTRLPIIRSFGQRMANLLSCECHVVTRESCEMEADLN
jgi:hypothetical protein